ncbi:MULTISPECIES: Nif3-like dinuclear metal center hexameric protein [unclassified Thioalkalivibrio]|uniref:Nif3-like dinuclear metal center hexameric protein n=1 Tax=unclassified Thioalkalivibrio TaxID=2621013 RepID=UPI000364AA78|nr:MULTISPECIES: Nif3-like dinuclear metal center hexameric protein [unclassified Thioalkalivibrio]
MHRDELLAGLDAQLEPARFTDYCPNGLQVEGRAEVRHVVSAVTASAATIEAAAERGADVLLVHHGYFWKGEPQVITGMKQRRIRRLLESGMNLVAYHLPLDAHPEMGNNASLARDLGLIADGTLRDDGVGLVGAPDEPLSAPGLASRIATALGREPLLVTAGEHPVRRVAWCSGGAQSLLPRAAELGADAYISGEISEQTTHEARELGVHYLAAGHHATERGGPRALGEWCARTFDLTHEFLDLDNPA